MNQGVNEMKLILLLFTITLANAQEIQTTNVITGTTGPRGKGKDVPANLTHHVYTNYTEAQIAEAIKNVPVVVRPDAKDHPTWTWAQLFARMTN